MHRYTNRTFLMALIIAATCLTVHADKKTGDGYTPIFDGKTLAGWTPLPGGTWEAKDGKIVGTSPKTERRHGMLLSDKQYSDFTIRLKFRSIKGNSGFYFRVDRVKSNVSVNGFQAEVAPDNSTGGLYETGGRGWVVQSDNTLMKKIYTPGEWTTMEVTAKGKDVSVKVNGHVTAELKNDKGRTKGYFGLQLHGGQDMLVEFNGIEIKVYE